MAMSRLRRRNFFLACLLVHLTLIVVVCAHETLSLLKQDVVAMPGVRRAVWQALDKVPETILGTGPHSPKSWKQAVATYATAAGIELGYGYFAPNIPPASALVFECHYSDGRVEYETPNLQGAAGRFRLSTLVLQIGRTDYDRWRIALIRLLSRAVWQRHPDAVVLRAFFGQISPPTIAQYRAGQRERTFVCLYVYDFHRGDSGGEDRRE